MIWLRRLWSHVLELVLVLILGGLLWLTLASGGGVAETSVMAQKPTLGRIVLYSFLKGGALVERPAEIVSLHGDDIVNLHVNLDGTNDLGLAGVTAEDCKRLAFWGTSIDAADNHETAQVGRWRWPPRE